MNGQKIQKQIGMKTIRWFDRHFDFNLEMDKFSGLVQDLAYCSYRLSDLTYNLSEAVLNFKPIEKWSIKEHIGHLQLLEKLWQRRLLDIKENKTRMSIADLNNVATDDAHFNKYPVNKLIKAFMIGRNKTVMIVESFEKTDYINNSIHPRFKKPMRMIDLIYFVSEHDKHHILSISNNIEMFSKVKPL